MLPASKGQKHTKSSTPTYGKESFSNIEVAGGRLAHHVRPNFGTKPETITAKPIAVDN